MTSAFLQVATSASDLSAYTFAAQNLGSADANRNIVAVVTGRSNDGGARTLTSVTINGVTAKIVRFAINSGSMIAIVHAKVPTDASGDVVVTWSSTMTNCAIALYSSVSQYFGVYDHGADTANALSYAIDCPAGGFVVAAARSDSGGTTSSWTNLTERYDGTDGLNDFSTASADFGTVQTDLAVSVSISAYSRESFVAVSFFAGVGQRISDTNDDVFVDETGGKIDFNGDGELIIGEHPTISRIYNGGFRFQAVNIPQGATVTNAKIRFINQSLGSGTPALLVSGEDVDDSAAFSTYANFAGRTPTTATDTWTPSPITADSRLETDNISAIVQEIVDRGGWAAGNDMTFQIFENGGTNAWILLYDYSWDPLVAAELIIEFTVSTNVTVNPSAQVVTSSVPARTISTGTKSTPSAQVSTFSVPAYTVSIPKTLPVNAQVATFSIPLYVVLAGDVLALPNAQVATFSVPAYSVLYGVTLSPNAQVDTFSIPAYTVAISEVLAVSAQGLLFSIPAYSISLGIGVAPSAQVATFSIPAYTQTAETRVSPSVKTLTFSIPAYSLALDMVLSAAVQSLIFSIPTLYNFGAVWEKVPRSTNSSWSRTSRNST